MRRLTSIIRPVAKGGTLLIRDLFGLVLPSGCLLCREPPAEPGGPGLCPACEQRLTFFESHLCPGCGGAPVQSPLDFCPACGGNCHRDGLLALGPYREGVRELIHHFKYGADLSAGRYLASRLAEKVREEMPGTLDVVVPVPLHRRRLRSRGFNQSGLLARRVSRETGRPLLAGALTRLADTLSLSGLDRRRRRRELRGVIGVRRSAAVAGRRVLLVDDVFTSGATSEECCRVLKKAGALSTVVAAVGRTGTAIDRR